MVDNLQENIPVVEGVKKTEDAPKDIFFVELDKWQKGVLEGSLSELSRVCSRTTELLKSMDVSEKDKKLISICPEFLKAIERCGRMERQDAKIESVRVQQLACSEIMSRFHNGKFDDEKAPAFFYAMTVIINRLHGKGLLGQEFRRLSGLRGMVSADILFTKAGFEVTLPNEKADANYDIDLHVAKRGKTFGLSVKSNNDHVNTWTNEAFEIRRMKKPENFPTIYSTGIDGYLWINIPGQSTEDAAAYCEKKNSAESLAIGLPSDFMTAYFLKDCGDIHVPE